jgi:hypothetical protein
MILLSFLWYKLACMTLVTKAVVEEMEEEVVNIDFVIKLYS